MELIVSPDARGMMIEHCERGYPEESCGALLGASVAARRRTAVRVLPIVNERNTERRTRYLIGPEEFRASDAAARAGGLDIVGFYHSHPDHPAVPSAFDREHAWPWYLYVIIPVEDGLAGVARGWQLTDDRSHFAEIDIVYGAVELYLTQEAT